MCLLTGRSKGPGVLVTNDGMMKYQKSGADRKGRITWWTCSEKLPSGCPGRAHLEKTTKEGPDGKMEDVYELVKISKLEVKIFSVRGMVKFEN